MRGEIPVKVGGIQGDEPRQVATPQHLILTLRGQICEPCNNGWLSRLESAVKPILAPMAVDGKTTELDASAQKSLATWAVKTALLLEFAIRQRYPDARAVTGYVASEVERTWLMTGGEPPPRGRVWIGGFDARNRVALRFESANLSAVGRESAEVPAHLTTLSVGYVAFQVFTIDFVVADSVGASHFPDPPAAYSPVLRGISPPRSSRSEPLDWPGEHKFTDEHWHMIATWPHRAYQRPAA